MRQLFQLVRDPFVELLQEVDVPILERRIHLHGQVDKTWR